MNIIAFLLIIALIGLIVAVVHIADTARRFVSLGKKGYAALQRPKNSALQIYNTGLGYALGAANRIRNTKSRIDSAINQVKASTRNVNTLIGDLILKVTRATETMEDAAANSGPTMQAMDFIRQFSDVLKQVR